MDIEEILASYLQKRLDAHVSASVPYGDEYPERMVTFERTGGGYSNLVIDRPTVAIQCWAKTRKEAKDLAYEVDELVRYMADIEPSVASAERSSLYCFPDPESRLARYQVVCDFVVQV